MRPASQTVSRFAARPAARLAASSAARLAARLTNLHSRSAIARLQPCTVEALHIKRAAHPRHHTLIPARQLTGPAMGLGQATGARPAPSGPGRAHCMNLQPNSEIAAIASMHGTWRSAVVCLRKRSDRASFLPGSFRAAGG